MLPNRFRISQRATETLKIIKGRTGVTPNVLCRISFMLSLRDGARSGEVESDLSGSEFNTPTLFGDYHLVYEALIRQLHGPLEPKDIQRVVAAHIDSGVDQLRRVRSLSDLLTFTPAVTPRSGSNA